MHSLIRFRHLRRLGIKLPFFHKALPIAAMVVRTGASGRRRVKKIKRKKSLGASNLKLQGRRRAATEFNELLIQLGADVLILGRGMAWQISGKRLASAWQAGGKRPVFLASARFTMLGEAKTYAFLTFLVLGIPPKCPLYNIKREKCRR